MKPVLAILFALLLGGCSGSGEGGESGGLLRLVPGGSEAEDPAAGDPLVRCTVGTSATFMRQSDCELRGGRAAPTEARQG